MILKLNVLNAAQYARNVLGKGNLNICGDMSEKATAVQQGKYVKTILEKWRSMSHLQ